MTAPKDGTLTITMTGRPPVTVSKETWPLIAEATDHLYDGQYDFQANTHTRAALRVRQHADGRAVVYGTYSYETNYPGSRDGNARRGHLLAAGEDISAAITAVGKEMDAARHNQGVTDHFDEPSPFARLASECTADLPAEELA